MTKALLTGVALACSFYVFADPVDSVDSAAPSAIFMEQFQSQADVLAGSIKLYSGKIRFADQAIRLTIPEHHYFIEADQARYILEDLWGNAPDETVLGMIVKQGFNPAQLANDYSFVLSYTATGFIPFDDKKQLDHDYLLEGMQNQINEENEVRLRNGHNALYVTNWVMVPYYDSFRKALYWATELGVNGSDEHLLNYNLRLLGKKGVLKINAVATMDQLPVIKKFLPYLLSQARFEEGSRYQDQPDQAEAVSSWELEELIIGQQEPKKSTGLSVYVSIGIATIISLVFLRKLFTFYRKKPTLTTA